MRLPLLICAAICGLAMTPAPTNAQVIFNPANGHYYEQVTAPGLNLNWHQALESATARTFAGGTGYLATITSAEEQAFIHSNFAFDTGSANGFGTWIGGFQPSGSPEPGGAWEWITNESFNYKLNADFANNAFGTENVLEIRDNAPFEWNDLTDTFTRSSYLVEYAPGVATDVTMFTQRAQYGLGTFGSLWTTGSDGGTGGFRTYDGFSVQFDTLVRQVSWQALTLGTTSLQTPITEAWQLGIYADAAGQPGAALLQETVSATDVVRSLAGTAFLSGDPKTYNVYNYTANLSVDFLADAGTTYWFSPFSKQATFNPFQAWMAGNGGNNITYQDNVSNGNRFVRNGDRAFSVRGLNAAVAVPEPGTLALLALPLVGFAAYRKRRA